MVARFLLLGSLVWILTGCASLGLSKIGEALWSPTGTDLGQTTLDQEQVASAAHEKGASSEAQTASTTSAAPSEPGMVDGQESKESAIGHGGALASIQPQVHQAVEDWSLPARAAPPAERPQSMDVSPQLGIGDHQRIDAFVTYYRERDHEGIRRGLARSTAFLQMIQAVFRQEGMPEDLAYLPFIESGFDPTARSRKGAVGLWQFMEGTARKYGLRIDWWMDERRDPESSTRAAAQYLKELFSLFGSWDLAVAAYNGGEGKISRCLKRREAESFWDLCRYGDLRRETKDFLPRFMAVLKIAKDPQGYGFMDIPYEEPWRFDTVSVDVPLDLGTVARLAGTTEEEIRALNPQFRRWCSPPGPPQVTLRAPEGTGGGFSTRLAALPENERLNVRVHEVDPGETLSQIARRYGSRMDLIQRMNRLRSVHSIRAGSRLMIPVPGRPPTMAVAVVREGLHREQPGGSQGPPGAAAGEGEAIVHRVKEGESLWGISRRYGVQVSDIRRWNNLKGHLIRPGDTLILLKRETLASHSSPAT